MADRQRLLALIKAWDETAKKAHKKNQVRRVLDGGLILFFKQGSQVFGAPEESRIVFSKMKTPDPDLPPEWAKNANFMALDLAKAMQGVEAQSVFGADDLDGLDVIDPVEAERLLMRMPGNKPLPTPCPDGVGVIRIDDEE